MRRGYPAIRVAALALVLAACASGTVDSDGDGGADIDSGGAAIDAATNVPDADPNAPDAAEGTPDAEAVPDAPPPPPDADPAMPPTVLATAPDTGSIAGGEPVVVTGSNFTGDATIAFGATTAACTVMSSTTIQCTSPATGAAGAVGVTATQTSGSHTLTAGFLYWDTASAVDNCNLVPPLHHDEVAGTATLWQARVNEAGITDATTGVDVSASLRGQVGYGPAGTDPATAPGWTWFDVTPTAGYGPASPTYQADFDQYEGGAAMPVRGQYRWSARFTIEDGVSWKFCGAQTMTSRLPIACAADATCFGDEKCLDGNCRVFCDTATQCFGWGPSCSGLGLETDETTLELFCVPGFPGAGATGAACTSGPGCESGFCLVDLTDTCTIGCGTSDALCPSSDVCTEFSGLGLCSPSCGATADCTAGHSCILNTNVGQNRYDTLCLVPDPAADPMGASCAGVINCESGLCLTGPELCTGPCNTAADCPASLPVCGLGTITRPNGVGTQSMSICVQ